MRTGLRLRAATLIGLIGVGLFAAPAMATTGPGCFQPKSISAGDVLNVRSRPSARSSIVTTIPPGGGPIIARRGKCGSWCSVSIYDGDNVYNGWIKRKFLRDSQCP